jgi:hypothetical protein
MSARQREQQEQSHKQGVSRTRPKARLYPTQESKLRLEPKPHNFCHSPDTLPSLVGCLLPPLGRCCNGLDPTDGRWHPVAGLDHPGMTAWCQQRQSIIHRCLKAIEDVFFSQWRANTYRHPGTAQASQQALGTVTREEVGQKVNDSLHAMMAELSTTLM